MANRGSPPLDVRSHTVPGPRGYPLLGVLPQLRRNPLRLFIAAARAYGDVVCLPAGSKRVYLVNHPDHIKRVLQDNHRNYRLTPFYGKLRPIFGEGLLTSEGDLWHRQRHLIQPAFHRQRLEGLGTLMTAAAATMLGRWEVLAAKGEPLDVAKDMGRLTLGIVVRAMFGVDGSGRTEGLSRSIAQLLETAVKRTTALTDLGERLPTPRNLRFRRALRTLDEFVSGIIEDRRREGGGRRDLLSLLLEARDRECGKGMSESQLHDEVKTMLVGGSVTTANALTWTWYLISQHPEVERRLHAEVADAIGGDTPTVNDLDEAGYTKMVVQEALRLFPPTWRLARMAIGDDEIGGYPIPAGSIVVFSPYLMHRHPGFWERPDDFDPERFAPARSTDRPHFVYFPFGGGPRMCIGTHFAMMEMQLIVAMVAQRFRLHLPPGQPVDLVSLATLRPRHNLMMTLKQQRNPE